MIKPPIGELLQKTDCRYTLVVETAKRARALIEGAQPLIEVREEMKPITIAIDEVNRGLIEYNRSNECDSYY